MEAGEADAGVITPLRNRDDVPEEAKKMGLALSTDANPLYGQIRAYWQAANAVVESCRNVAAVGATPICITDCLNYGSPEIPDQMQDFVSGVEGIADALNGIGLRSANDAAAAEVAEAMTKAEKDSKKKGKKAAKVVIPKPAYFPLPCISGNVSLYNVSEKSSIAPQAIIATLGKMENVERATTPGLKSRGNHLFLIGPRKNELGGSAYYNLMGELGANVPEPDFALVSKEIAAVTDIISAGYALSCHDISDGGLAVAIAEMCIGSEGVHKVGAKVTISTIDEQPTKKNPKVKPLRTDQKLFSETGGFVLEIPRKDINKAKRIAASFGVPLIKIGFTTSSKKLIIFDNGKDILNVKLGAMRTAWRDGLRNKL